MFNKSLTIVLPVHNGESRLRKNVGDLLELASELTAKFGVLIVDDGSTDSTFEVAEELAAAYPQVAVRRHRQCRGLGATIDYVRRRVNSDAVILHDGVSPINAHSVRQLWRQWVAQSTVGHGDADLVGGTSCGVADFAHLPQMQAAMQRAHRQLLGFQLLATTTEELSSTDHALPPTTASRADASHVGQRTGVGQIPSLPRPNFLSTLANFAIGE